jgi:hypothetical protein
MHNYRREIQHTTDDRTVTVKDLRTGKSIVETGLAAFRLTPASSQFKERFMVVEVKGYLVSIPIVLVVDRASYRRQTKERLEEAMQILDIESDLQSEQESVRGPVVAGAS